MIIRIIGDEWFPEDKIVISVNDEQPVKQCLPQIMKKLGISNIKEYALSHVDGRKADMSKQIDAEKTWKTQGVVQGMMIYIRKRGENEPSSAAQAEEKNEAPPSVPVPATVSATESAQVQLPPPTTTSSSPQNVTTEQSLPQPPLPPPQQTQTIDHVPPPPQKVVTLQVLDQQPSPAPPQAPPPPQKMAAPTSPPPQKQVPQGQALQQAYKAVGVYAAAPLGSTDTRNTATQQAPAATEKAVVTEPARVQPVSLPLRSAVDVLSKPVFGGMHQPPVASRPHFSGDSASPEPERGVGLGVGSVEVRGSHYLHSTDDVGSSHKEEERLRNELRNVKKELEEAHLRENRLERRVAELEEKLRTANGELGTLHLVDDESRQCAITHFKQMDDFLDKKRSALASTVSLYQFTHAEMESIRLRQQLETERQQHQQAMREQRLAIETALQQANAQSSSVLKTISQRLSQLESTKLRQ